MVCGSSTTIKELLLRESLVKSFDSLASASTLAKTPSTLLTFSHNCKLVAQLLQLQLAVRFLWVPRSNHII